MINEYGIVWIENFNYNDQYIESSASGLQTIST